MIMRTIRCQEFGPPQSLQRVEVELPAIEPSTVLVRITAAGVGFVDGLMIQGRYQVKPALPYFPGSEFAGVVETVGSDVSQLQSGQLQSGQLQSGDRVMGMASSGAFSDYVAVPAKALIRIPDRLNDATAAGLYINYATALYGLRDCGDLQPGETILVLGAAGGVGSAAICVAKAMGAHVIAAASNEAKRNAALAWGADAVVDYSVPGWRDDLKTQIGLSGLQLVYDPVGGGVAEPAFRSLSPGGRFLVVGFASGEIPSIALNLALLKRASIVGVDWGGESRAHPEITAQLLATLADWIDTGRLIPAPVHCRPMADYALALEDQLAGRIVGKLVLEN
jgi:NADPH2:quinone reductase